MILFDAALVVLALALLVAVLRLATGPTQADRALGVDLGFAAATAAFAVLSVRLRTPAMLDLVLVATLVGFLSTVAFARLVGGRASS